MRNIGLFIRRNWIIICIVLFFVIVTWIMIRKAREEEEKRWALALSANLTSVFPLHESSQGEEVKNLQRYLNNKGEALEVDGIFGPLTAAAVQRIFSSSTVNEQQYKEIVLPNL